MTELSAADHAELVSRLTALRRLAGELQEVFDHPETREGADKMAASIDRMLAILGAAHPED